MLLKDFLYIRFNLKYISLCYSIFWNHFFKVECSTIYFISPTVRSYATAIVTSDGNAVESFVLHDTAITTVNATAAVFFAVVADIVHVRVVSPQKLFGVVSQKTETETTKTHSNDRISF